MSKIPFFNLSKLNSEYSTEVLAEIAKIVRESAFLLGSRLSRFEGDFARFCSTEYAIGVNSGLDALTIALRSLMEKGLLKKNDSVAVPANTFVATFLSVIHAGLIPVPIDVDETCYNVSLSNLKGIGQEIRCLIVVHLYGYMHQMQLLEDYCRGADIQLVEDAAQAHGARFDGKPAGSFGIAAAFSFYPAKNLGAFGDAGAITTSDVQCAQYCKTIRNYGSEEKYYHDTVGYNSRMDEIQAAVLMIKLRGLAKEIEARNAIARKYVENITNEKLTLPNYELTSRHICAYHQFVISVNERDKFREHLAQRGIETLVHYPIPAYRQTCFGQIFGEYTCSSADKLAGQIVSLPIHSGLTSDEVEQIIDHCQDY